MTYFDPASGTTLILQSTPLDETGVISFYPSIIIDSTAAAEEQLAAESCNSFMQTQWRAAAANMDGVGVITSGWA